MVKEVVGRNKERSVKSRVSGLGVKAAPNHVATNPNPDSDREAFILGGRKKVFNRGNSGAATRTTWQTILTPR